MDAQSALNILDEAEASGSTREIALHRALACKMLGDYEAALIHLDRALAYDPYDFVALLSKGAVLEKAGKARDAAVVYRNAIKIAPPRKACPPALQMQIDHANGIISRDAQALRDAMAGAVASLRSAADERTLDRFDEAVDILSGLKTPPKQEPLLLHYPRLPPIGFYDRSHFPWLERLEAATPVIQRELAAVLESGMDDFAPYIAFPPGAPVNQWAELNHSRKWTTLFLWRDGVRQDAVCDACPETAALLRSLPMADQPGFAPTAVFSALEPGAHIPAHTGSTNVRLLCHLPLILPGPARFRVGNATRKWEIGKAWVFDDTIEHEAWNEADGLRVILIFDVWNPFLAEAEKNLITAMMQAHRRFRDGA